MHKLNLPEHQFKYRQSGSKKYIFDEIRMKYVACTPEEWVRQNFVKYLIIALNYPKPLISIEREITVNRLVKRCDAVVFSRIGEPCMLLEFKAPEVKLNQVVFDQIVRYNIALNVRYLLISNGLKHYCCELDFVKKDYKFLSGVPDYNDLNPK